MAEQPKGPFCQSCGAPLEKPSDFGTGTDGFRINDYCHFCFEDGAFTEPGITRQAMIDRCAGFMSREGIMPETQAKARMTDVIPKLKRWLKA
jgi:hypothetical protein